MLEGVWAEIELIKEVRNQEMRVTIKSRTRRGLELGDYRTEMAKRGGEEARVQYERHDSSCLQPRDMNIPQRWKWWEERG